MKNIAKNRFSSAQPFRLGLIILLFFFFHHENAPLISAQDSSKQLIIVADNDRYHEVFIQSLEELADIYSGSNLFKNIVSLNRLEDDDELNERIAKRYSSADTRPVFQQYYKESDYEREINAKIFDAISNADAFLKIKIDDRASNGDVIELSYCDNIPDLEPNTLPILTCFSPTKTSTEIIYTEESNFAKSISRILRRFFDNTNHGPELDISLDGCRQFNKLTYYCTVGDSIRIEAIVEDKDDHDADIKVDWRVEHNEGDLLMTGNSQSLIFSQVGLYEVLASATDGISDSVRKSIDLIGVSPLEFELSEGTVEISRQSSAFDLFPSAQIDTVLDVYTTQEKDIPLQFTIDLSRANPIDNWLCKNHNNNEIICPTYDSLAALKFFQEKQVGGFLKRARSRYSSLIGHGLLHEIANNQIEEMDSVNYESQELISPLLDELFLARKRSGTIHLARVDSVNTIRIQLSGDIKPGDYYYNVNTEDLILGLASRPLRIQYKLIPPLSIGAKAVFETSTESSFGILTLALTPTVNAFLYKKGFVRFELPRLNLLELVYRFLEIDVSQSGQISVMDERRVLDSKLQIMPELHFSTEVGITDIAFIGYSYQYKTARITAAESFGLREGNSAAYFGVGSNNFLGIGMDLSFYYSPWRKDYFVNIDLSRSLLSLQPSTENSLQMFLASLGVVGAAMPFFDFSKPKGITDYGVFAFGVLVPTSFAFRFILQQFTR